MLTQLNMCVACMQETMRLYPAGGIATFRLATHGKPVILGGGKLVVLPNVLLHMPITAIQRTAANWEQPEEFLPERWEQVRRRALAGR